MRIGAAFLGLSLVAGVALATPPPAEAQILKKAKETAKRAAEDQALLELEERVRNAVTCTFDDIQCINVARGDDEDVVLVDHEGELILDEDGQPISDPGYLPPEYQTDAGASATAEAALDPNYDFEAGADVLFEDDYMGDNVGDFPRRMEFVRGNWDVVERGGMRLLRNTGPRHSAVKIPLPEVLPETFTIEVPVLLYEGNANLALATSVPPAGGGGTTRVFHYAHNYFDIGSWGVGVASRNDANPTATQEVDDLLTSGLVPVRIMVDGRYAKVYVGERRVANVPNADLERSDVLWIENTYAASEEDPILIGPIRVAAGGRDLYDVLEAKGRVTVEGILFDTDQATIKQESAEVLAEVAAMLEAHPDLALLVEGHTDDQGGFEHNMTLSKERADAVKAWLVEGHGVDADRLRTIGLGPTQPVEDNDTDEGRAKNRRVELVRMNGPGSRSSGPQGSAAAPSLGSEAAEDRSDAGNAASEAGPPAAGGVDAVGQIALVVDGEEQTFPVLRSERPGRASGWSIGLEGESRVLRVALHGATGSTEEALFSGDRVALHLSFYMDQALAHRCDPMSDHLEYAVGEGRHVLTADECGGIVVENVRHDPASDTYLVSGRLRGSLHRSGVGATGIEVDGSFEAQVPPREGG